MEQALYWLVGAVGVPLISWIKNRFGLSGKGAVWLTLAVAAVLAAGSLFLSQELTGADFTPENLFSVLGQILAAATLAYKLLRGED
jgi:membrane-associated PAP2 superfamily phosphatase